MLSAYSLFSSLFFSREHEYLVDRINEEIYAPSPRRQYYGVPYLTSPVVVVVVGKASTWQGGEPGFLRARRPCMGCLWIHG